MAETVYVFRLTSFDKNGNKIAKRKYGYTAKSSKADDLDEVVYRGIKSRAETAFSLQKSQYYLWLVLPEGHDADKPDAPFGLPYLPTTTDEVVLYNYVGSFGTFKRFRTSMAKTVADAKGRKVINLCVVPNDYVMPTEKAKIESTISDGVPAVLSPLPFDPPAPEAPVPNAPVAGSYVPNVRATTEQMVSDARASADAINAQVNAQIQEQLAAIRQNAERTRTEAAQMAPAVAAQANATAIAVSGDVARARSAMQAAIKADVEKTVNDSKASVNNATESVKKMAKEYIDMSGLIHGTESHAHARFSQNTQSLVQNVLSSNGNVQAQATTTAGSAPTIKDYNFAGDKELRDAMTKAYNLRTAAYQTRPSFPGQGAGAEARSEVEKMADDADKELQAAMDKAFPAAVVAPRPFFPKQSAGTTAHAAAEKMRVEFEKLRADPLAQAAKTRAEAQDRAEKTRADALADAAHARAKSFRAAMAGKVTDVETFRAAMQSKVSEKREKSGRDPTQYQHAFGAYAQRSSPFAALRTAGASDVKVSVSTQKKDVKCEICSLVLPNEAVLAKHMFFHPHVKTEDANTSGSAAPGILPASAAYQSPAPPLPKPNAGVPIATLSSKPPAYAPPQVTYAPSQFAWPSAYRPPAQAAQASASSLAIPPVPQPRFGFRTASNGWTPASGPWNATSTAQAASRPFAGFFPGHETAQAARDANVRALAAANANARAIAAAAAARAAAVMAAAPPKMAEVAQTAPAAPTDAGTPVNTGAVKAEVGAATGNKYVALKNSMDRFVAEFNDAMADMFAVPAEQRESVKVQTTESPVLEAEGEKESAVPAVKTEKVEEKSEEAKPHKHRATCDVCGIWIVGTRFKCIDCPDWDCCGKCSVNVGDAHPEHTLVKVNTPSDLVTQPRKAIRHSGIYCDSCNKPVGDIRYKCTHADCADFDLCAQCEADPVSYAVGRKIGSHDFSSHIMLKLRQPVGRFGARMSGSPARNLASAIGQARRFLSQNDAQTAQANASSTDAEASTDKTLVVDIPVPFAVANGQQEISIPLDIGRNAQGEAVILGLAKEFANVISSAVDAVKEGFKQASPAASEMEDIEENNEDAADPEDAYVSAASIVEQSARGVETLVEAANASVDVPIADVSKVTEKEDALDASWVADVTFEDGAAVAPGTMFNKVWSVKNTGKTAWPVGTQLVCVGGFGSSSTSSSRSDVRYDLIQAEVGEIVSVTASDIVAPEVPGKFMSYYRFVSPDGGRFGDRLWLDINVEEHEGRRWLTGSHDSSNANSLNSSSVITPSVRVKNASPLPGTETTHEAAAMSASPSQATAATTVSALTSPRSAISELPDDEVTSATVSTSGDMDDDFVLLSDEDDDFAEIASIGSST